jgi:hypothetical protein
MDIFFQDPEDIPLPPEEVRIREFHANAWPDGRRVRVYLELTAFQKRPSGEISILDEHGEEVANIAIIETIDPRMEFTLHMRTQNPMGEYTALTSIFYTEMELEEENREPDDPSAEKPPPPQPEKVVVDQAETTFRIEDF